MERVILFAKSPRLNGVKTRLVPPLSAETALELHEAMLHDQVAFLRALGGPGREIEACLDGPADLPGVACTLQGPGHLGVRLARAFDRAFRCGCARAVAIGADAPTLPRSLVEDVLGLVSASAPAAVVPALDGGYVAIALAAPLPRLFEDIPWGTRDVLRTTCARAAESGTRLQVAATWGDVDTPGDLERLRRECALDPGRAPRTAALLSRLAVV